MVYIVIVLVSYLVFFQVIVSLQMKCDRYKAQADTYARELDARRL